MTICNVNWRAFGVSPPDPAGPCDQEAPFRIMQGCVHEHVQEALVCDHHLMIMRTYLPLEEWGCGSCAWHEERPHSCHAPVVATALDPRPGAGLHRKAR